MRMMMQTIGSSSVAMVCCMQCLCARFGEGGGELVGDIKRGLQHARGRKNHMPENEG